jgi:hypothetical protein
MQVAGFKPPVKEKEIVAHIWPRVEDTVGLHIHTHTHTPIRTHTIPTLNTGAARSTETSVSMSKQRGVKTPENRILNCHSSENLSFRSLCIDTINYRALNV